jgi:HK97 family phage prohead protease
MATTISGYAALYGVETVIAGTFREVIMPGAFADTVKHDDVRALFNHDPNLVLGRTKSGTLTLSEDTKGLRYTVQINSDDAMATDVAARIARRDVSGSSFGFRIANPEADETWEPPAKRGGLPLRRLLRLQLFDVSPVVYPAYEETTVAARDGNADAVAKRERIRLQIELAKARLA